jgi:hypothetical protein
MLGGTVNQRSTTSRRLWRLAAASGIALGVFLPASAAFAADYPDGGNTPTAPSDPGSTDAAQVAAKTQARGDLPFTGGDVAGLAAIGTGAVVVGGVLAAQSRRRRSEARS